MQLQTSDLLTELDFTNEHNLKRLYNYNLASNRIAHESFLEAREEFM